VAHPGVRGVVAVARVELRIPAAASLKDKRSVVKSFCERARQRFGLAVAETARQEDPQRASLTLAAVSGSGAVARQSLRSAVAFLEETYEVEVLEAVEEIF
jgi:hypothetical protein